MDKQTKRFVSSYLFDDRPPPDENCDDETIMKIMTVRILGIMVGLINVGRKGRKVGEKTRVLPKLKFTNTTLCGPVSPF